MSELDPTALLQPAATRVRDPVSGRSVWLAGMVRNVRTKGEDLVYDLHFTVEHPVADRQSIQAAIEENLRGLGFQGKVYAMPAGAPPRMATPTAAPAAPSQDPVKGMSGPGMQPHGGPIQKKPVAGVKHIVAVASGKGGVGKSTVATNLAVALHRLGHTVGLLDADVHGPSVPTMMAAPDRPLADPTTRKILPIVAHGVRCLSMGMLVDPEEAMIWRGPMVMSAIRQFLQDADWSGTDYLIIDLPPGTSDASMSMAQDALIAGAVIVSTPAKVSIEDARKAVGMFDRLGVPIFGVVENMTSDIFGRGGAREAADELGLEFLGEIPLDATVRVGGDEGVPVVVAHPDSPIAEAFIHLAEQVAARCSVLQFAGEGGAL